MKKSHLLYLVCCAAAAFGASDYFPAEVGNTWEFDYRSFTGHSAGGTTDSGIVTWEITEVQQQGTTKIVAITQQHCLKRRIFFMAGNPDKYDSVFNPPRELPPENIAFVDSGNILYRKYSRDRMQTTEVLVHDKKGPIPSSICVKDTSIEVLKTIRQAALVITGTCDLSPDDPNSSVIKHKPFDYFLQCDSIGPVAYLYDSQGTALMVGGHNYENWVLRSFPTGISHTYAKSGDIRVGNRPQLVPLLGVPARWAFIHSSVYNLRGRVMPDLSRFGKKTKGAGIVVVFPDKALDGGNDNKK
jgi:hypothetical protein